MVVYDVDACAACSGITFARERRDRCLDNDERELERIERGDVL
jgi:hypothetical protein